MCEQGGKPRQYLRLERVGGEARGFQKAAQPRREAELAVGATGADGHLTPVAPVVRGFEFAEVAVAEAVERAGERQRGTPAVVFQHEGVAQRGGRRLAARLPLAAGVEHFHHAAAGKTGALHVDAQAAGHRAGGPRVLDAERNRLRLARQPTPSFPLRHLGGEEPLIERARGVERLLAALRRGVHHREQRGPIHLRGPPEHARAGIVQPRGARADERVADFIQPATARAAKHLQQLIRRDLLLEVAHHVARVRHDHAAHGKVDPRRQPHRRHHRAELPGFGQRLDQTRTLRVAQPAVVIGHARREQLRQPRPGELLLFERQRERGIGGQRCGEVARQFLGGAAARGEKEDRSEIGPQRIGDQPRPPTAHAVRRFVRQRFQVHLLQRHRTFAVRHEHRIAPDAPQPRHDFLRIRHAPAEQQELRLRRRERQRKLIGHAAQRVRDHLIFIHHEQPRPRPLEEFPLLRFERRHHDLRAQIEREIARRQPHLPAARLPLRELVIGQRARRHGENRLALQLRHKQLEDIGFPRPGRRMDHDILPPPERLHGVLLPEVGNGEAEHRARSITRPA